ncbi:MAG: hypothetical protein R3C29_17730 [Dehalococcoidia bacterium]
MQAQHGAAAFWLERHESVEDVDEELAFLRGYAAGFEAGKVSFRSQTTS